MLRARLALVIGLSAAVCGVGNRPLEAQILFDWPVRAEATPEALLTGAPSLLWNPAGTVAPSDSVGREVWVVHIDGPDASGIQGLAGAVVFDLPLVGQVGAVYQHLGIPDIDRTTDSPEPEPGSLTVTEDLIVLGLARRAGSRVGLGGSVRLLRATVGGELSDRASVDLGAQAVFDGHLAPRVGLALRSLGTQSDVLLGADVRVPAPAEQLRVGAGYGVQSALSRFDPDHRLTARGTWDGVLVVGVGAQSNRGNGWTPSWEVRLDVGRYSLGVVRESLPNDFGAAHYFQATIGLD